EQPDGQNTQVPPHEILHVSFPPGLAPGSDTSFRQSGKPLTMALAGYGTVTPPTGLPAGWCRVAPDLDENLIV
ncbi:MAG: hypothetical protein WCF22_18505, partial [Candidatus Sulfotelmatobacter sp.]